MNRDGETQLSGLMCDLVGGRTPWIVLWSNANDDGMLSNVDPEDVREMLCVYLLKMLRREMGPAAVVAREH